MARKTLLHPGFWLEEAAYVLSPVSANLQLAHEPANNILCLARRFFGFRFLGPLGRFVGFGAVRVGYPIGLLGHPVAL